MEPPTEPAAGREHPELPVITGAAFEVLDALGGFCRLERRDGTLDGSVPLRVAQGCVPLLEGNAFGWQVVLARELEVEKRLGGWIVQARERPDELRAAWRASVPRLVAQGFLEPAWAAVLDQGPGAREGGLWGQRLRLWTGLLVRPRAGVWLRVSPTANRRNVQLEVATHYVDEGWVPLVLTLTLARPEMRLGGEVATVAPVAPRASWQRRALVEAPDVGRAHGDFYDAGYFATKKGEITRKYRKLIRKQPDDDRVTTAACDLVEAGPAAHQITPVGPFVGADSPTPREQPRGDGSLAEVCFANLIPFRATFDGHRLVIDPDKGALAAGGKQVEARFAEALGPTFQAEHRGALWYLTKYLTPHPAGEAHFFVKPWAFVRTPPGWSSLVEGEHGAGYDVMRGVVSTDRFHATPAVFWLHGPTSITVPAGAPLVRVVPVPRSLLTAGWRAVGWRDREV